MSMIFITGRGNARKSVELPAWAAKSARDTRERIVEDVKAITLRPATFGNFSGSF